MNADVLNSELKNLRINNIFFILIPKSVIVIPSVNRWNTLGVGYTHVWRHFIFVGKYEFLILSHGKYGRGVRCCHSFLRQKIIIIKKTWQAQKRIFPYRFYTVCYIQQILWHYTSKILGKKKKNKEVVWLL